MMTPEEATQTFKRYERIAVDRADPETALAAAVALTRLLQREPVGDATRRWLEVRTWAETASDLAQGLAARRFKFWGDAPPDPSLVAALTTVVVNLPALAATGDAEAQYELAYFLGEGLVCPHSPQKAYHWLVRAGETHLAAAFRRVWALPSTSPLDAVEMYAAYEPALALAEAMAGDQRAAEGRDSLAPRWREARDRWLATRPAAPPPAPPPPVPAPSAPSAPLVPDWADYCAGPVVDVSWEIEELEVTEVFLEPPRSTLFWAVEDVLDEADGGLAIFIDGQAVNQAARETQPDRPPVQAPPVPPMITLASPRSYPDGIEPPVTVFFEGRPIGTFPEGPPGPATHEARGSLLLALADEAPAWAGSPRAFLADRGISTVDAIAAVSGDGAACVEVALAFGKGDGVARDHEAAYVWLSLGAAAGDPRARRWLALAPHHDVRPLLDAIALAWWEVGARAAG